jgi:hypothetical protein
LCGRRTDHAELGGRNRHYRGGKKAATIVVGLFDHFLPPIKFLQAKTRSFVILVALDEIVITRFYSCSRSCSACFTVLWVSSRYTLGKSKSFADIAGHLLEPVICHLIRKVA